MAGPASWPGTPTGVSERKPLLLLLGFVGIVVVLVAGAAIWRGTGDGPVDANTMPPAATALSGEAIVGTTHEIGSETSDPGQKTTLRVPADGPLAGMTIEIPGDAYAEQTSFTVSAQDLQLSGYDGKITALTDLVVVENGGAYSASPMTVTIPVAIPADSFAMGLYLREDGTLEPMPLVDETSSSVTVVSRHFSRFFVAAIAEAALPENIGTGFRAGEDDFQTPNHGSYIAPHGHCGGQSLAEMWYFAERRAAGAPPLWGLTDNNGKGATPSFWEDDSSAYRLSSMVQKDLDWETLSRQIELAFGDARVDQLQWDAFRYAMLITGQPQYVRLSASDAQVAHAVVAYAATPTGLWIADPNYPGKLRDIEWDQKARAFKPYDSGLTAATSNVHFDTITFLGKTAMIDWDKIGERWAQVDRGSIGTDRFPLAVLMIEILNPDGTYSWSPMRDGPINTTQPRLQLTAESNSPDMRATLYDGTREIGRLDSVFPHLVTLPNGLTDLGVYIEAKDPKDPNAEWEAVDFYHYNLTAPTPPSSTPLTSAEPTPPAPDSTYDCSAPRDTEAARIGWILNCSGYSQPPLDL
jgi:hypothetical protein